MEVIRRHRLTIISNRNHPEANNRSDLSSKRQQIITPPRSNNSNKRTYTRAKPSQATTLARTHTLRAATPSSPRTLQSSTLSKIQILEPYHREPAHPRDIVALPAVCHPIKTSKCHSHLAQWEKVRCRSHLSA